MASETSTTSHNEERIVLLWPIRSKVIVGELEQYYDLYDIPRSFTLVAPSGDELVYRHCENRASLYLAHLKYG